MNKIVPRCAKIKVWRGVYAHWGTHLVNGLVIEKDKKDVAIRRLEDNFNPSAFNHFGVFCGNQVEKAAVVGILEDFKRSSQYNLLLNNCERAPTGFSEQSLSAILFAAAAGTEIQFRRALTQQSQNWIFKRTFAAAPKRWISWPIAAAGVGLKIGKHLAWDEFVRGKELGI